MEEPLLFHATCVSIKGKGVVLFGPSGCGKSDLALRLINDGAVLVADDYIYLSHKNDTLFATCPGTIRGMIEARGVGILKLKNVDEVPVALFIDLDAKSPIDRLPLSWTKLPIDTPLNIPCLALKSFENGTAAKIKLALESDFFLEKNAQSATKKKRELK